MQDPTDPLSPTARHLLKLNPNAYAALVATGSGSVEARDLLESVNPAQLLASGVLGSAEDGDAMMAGLWLWHDWLDESHVISQGLHSVTGSFWHAMLLAYAAPTIAVGHPVWREMRSSMFARHRRLQ
jgi:hypothetical protein